MSARVIDYTTMRAGTRAGAGRIERCPTCGRKGKMQRLLQPRTLGRPTSPFWVCTHTATDHGTHLSLNESHLGPIIDGTCRPPRKESAR